MRLHRFVWLFVALHFGLAIWYASATPYRQGGYLVHQPKAPWQRDIGAPDERQHVNYAWLISMGQLPVFDPKDPDLYERYQFHQPPLFYATASISLRFMKPDDDSPAAQLPFLAEERVGKTLRGVNGAIGAVGVLGIFFFVLWGWRNEAAALAAAAFASLLPMNLALSGAVSNDPLLFSLCSWCLAFAAKGIRDGWNTGPLLGGALTMGLAFLTKTTAIALWPAVGLGFLVSIRSGPQSKIQNPKSKIPAGVLLALLPLLIGLPWWLRNLDLYGDPFAISAFNQAFVGSPQASLFIEGFGSLDYWVTGAQSGTGVAWWTLRSFFGAFGYMDIFLPIWLYGVLALGMIAVLAAPIVRRNSALCPRPSSRGSKSSIVNRQSSIQTPDSKPQTPAVTLMSTLFFLLVLALFLRFNAQYFQGQARYLFPAIAPIAAAVGLGIARLAPKKPLAGAATLATILLALNLYALSILPGEFAKRVAPDPNPTPSPTIPSIP